MLNTEIKMRSKKDYCKDSFVDRLKEFDWSTINQKREVDIALETFNTMITQAMDDITPEHKLE